METAHARLLRRLLGRHRHACRGASPQLSGFPTASGSRHGFAALDLNAAVAGVDTLYVCDDRAVSSGGSGAAAGRSRPRAVMWALAATVNTGITWLPPGSPWTEGRRRLRRDRHRAPRASSSSTATARAFRRQRPLHWSPPRSRPTRSSAWRHALAPSELRRASRSGRGPPLMPVMHHRTSKRRRARVMYSMDATCRSAGQRQRRPADASGEPIGELPGASCRGDPPAASRAAIGSPRRSSPSGSPPTPGRTARASAASRARHPDRPRRAGPAPPEPQSSCRPPPRRPPPHARSPAPPRQVRGRARRRAPRPPWRSARRRRRRRRRRPPEAAEVAEEAGPTSGDIDALEGAVTTTSARSARASTTPTTQPRGR